jgi:hypothetical protein
VLLGRPWPAHGLARPRSRHVPTVQRNSGKPLFFEPIYCEIRLVMRSRLLRSLPVTIADIPRVLGFGRNVHFLALDKVLGISSSVPDIAAADVTFRVLSSAARITTVPCIRAYRTKEGYLISSKKVTLISLS